MKKTAALFFLLPVIAWSQISPDYFLSRLGPVSPSAGSVTFQWVATNHGSSASFYILDHVPAQVTLRSVQGETPGLPLDPSLPLSGSAAVTLGPFSLASGASTTFTVEEERESNASGDSFYLLTRDELLANRVESIVLSNPTLTPSQIGRAHV